MSIHAISRITLQTSQLHRHRISSASGRTVITRIPRVWKPSHFPTASRHCIFRLSLLYTEIVGYQSVHYALKETAVVVLV